MCEPFVCLVCSQWSNAKYRRGAHAQQTKVNERDHHRGGIIEALRKHKCIEMAKQGWGLIRGDHFLTFFSTPSDTQNGKLYFQKYMPWTKQKQSDHITSPAVSDVPFFRRGTSKSPDSVIWCSTIVSGAVYDISLLPCQGKYRFLLAIFFQIRYLALGKMKRWSW